MRCKKHGVVTAAVPWAWHNSRFTRNFEDTVAWLSIHASHVTVSEFLRMESGGLRPVWRNTALTPSAVSTLSMWFPGQLTHWTKSVVKPGPKPIDRPKVCQSAGRDAPQRASSPRKRSGRKTFAMLCSKILRICVPSPALTAALRSQLSPKSVWIWPSSVCLFRKFTAFRGRLFVPFWSAALIREIFTLYPFLFSCFAIGSHINRLPKSQSAGQMGNRDKGAVFRNAVQIRTILPPNYTSASSAGETRLVIRMLTAKSSKPRRTTWFLNFSMG